MEAILDRLWGADDGASIDAVRTHMKTLRRKLDESDQATGKKSKDSVIKTKRGLGYSIYAE
jgi:DNA-binding response OmpR family regulator